MVAVGLRPKAASRKLFVDNRINANAVFVTHLSVLTSEAAIQGKIWKIKAEV